MMNTQASGFVVFISDVNSSAARQGEMGLGELITLGQIRVVVDLLVKGACRLKLRAKSQAAQSCLFKSLPA